jgi:hypothetical protein
MRLLLFLLMLVFSVGVYGQEYTTEKNVKYYPNSVSSGDSYINSQCTMDIYYPKNVKGFSTLIWFHGGGLTQGQKEIPEALKNKGFAIIGVGYRLSPKVNAPAYIEDAAAAVAWAFKHIATYGGNADRIFVSGHSAGGYLGLMLTLNKAYLAKYSIDANRIAGLIPLSGQVITHFTVRQERGIKDTQAIIDNYAPIYFVRGDTPPILLITGDPELEMLGRYEENAYLLRMLKLVGNKQTQLLKLEGYDHGGMAQPAFPLLIKKIRAITDSLSKK